MVISFNARAVAGFAKQGQANFLNQKYFYDIKLNSMEQPQN